MKETILPKENISELETPDYHDGDFDPVVWEDEIPVMIEDSGSTAADTDKDK